MDKQVIHLLDGVIGVVVPDDANSFGIDHTGDIFYEYDVVANENMRTGWIGLQSLPPGQWQILGLGHQLTEEQWKGIVERQRGQGLYWHYNIRGSSLGQYGAFLLDTATKSGLSLLKSKSLDPSTTLILKRKA